MPRSRYIVFHGQPQPLGVVAQALTAPKPQHEPRWWRGSR
jgi:hypothetical protein